MGSTPTSGTMQPVRLEERDFKKIFKTSTPIGRALKFLKWGIKQLFSLTVLFFLFFYLLNFSAYWTRLKFSVDPPKTTALVIPTPVPNQPKPDYSPEIKIAKIGLDAPVITNIAIDQVIPTLVNGVVQLQGSATPGQNGNVVIFGHSSDYPWSTGHYKNIFALLDKLVVGDQIVIPFHDQEFSYTVTGSKVVKPTDLSVLNKTDGPTLTLITCYPVGTATNRLIITATLSGGTITGTQTSSPLSSSLPSSR